MATPLAAPLPEFPADAVLRKGPAAIEGSESISSVKASDVIAAAAKTSGATLVYCLRRPGCVLCRATALRLAALAPKLEADLGVTIICVANTWMPAEIDAFQKDFWQPPLEIYLDEDKAFFKALGNGTLRKGSLLHLLGLINPFSRVYSNAKRAKQAVGDNHNLVGEGLTLGGVIAVIKEKKTSSLSFAGGFQERSFGDAPTDEQVVELAKMAVEAAK